jgi:hypothetical protein
MPTKKKSGNRKAETGKKSKTAAVAEIGAPDHEPPTKSDVASARKDREKAAKAHRDKLQARQDALDKERGKKRGGKE